MKKLLSLVLLAGMSAPAVAQGWSAGDDGSISIPASVAGAKLAGASMTCQGGAYSLVLPGVTIGSGSGGQSPVALLVDKSVFATTADAATGMIAVPEAAIAALKSGSRLTLSFAAGAMQVETSFALRGSSKALESLAAKCQSAAASAAPTAAGSAVALEFEAVAEAGGSMSVTFKGPNGNGDWIGLAPVGSPGSTWLGGSYAYTSAGNPVTFPVPKAWGTYEVRYVTASSAVLLAKTVEVRGEGGPKLDAPATAVGGSAIDVTFEGPGGSDAFITIVKPEAPPTAIGEGSREGAGNSPATLRVPLEAGAFELRYVAAGKLVAKRDLTISPAPQVTIAPMEASAGQVLSVELPNAPRTAGDYLYIARAGTPDPDYGGGYVAVPATGPASIPAPQETGSWELKYMVPARGSYAVLGRAALTIK